ncbi:hypothetical protein G7Y79_00001g000300 [Physcia stellaris]|nr:hypothetical protein G7Y79_00001g000300 [Physcia stellaris]
MMVVGSRALRLPFEVRHRLARSHLPSLTLKHPKIGNPCFTSPSHQIREDSHLAYSDNTLFNFENTKEMVDYLSSIEATTLRQLRHISVRAHPFPIYPGAPGDKTRSTTYSFGSVLPLFPGLQLSTFRVRDSYHHPGTLSDYFGHEQSYRDVEELIENDGFRKLIYVSIDDRFLKAYLDPKATLDTRHPQPSTWDKLIKKRDGENSGAGVEIFRLTKDGPINVKDEFEYVQRSTWKERREPIEVHVTQGNNAEFVQLGRCVRDWNQGLYDLFQKFSWKEIKELEMDAEVFNDDPSVHL